MSFVKTAIILSFFILGVFGAVFNNLNCASLSSSPNSWCVNNCNSNGNCLASPLSAQCSCEPPLPAAAINGSAWFWYNTSAHGCSGYSQARCQQECTYPTLQCNPTCCERCADIGCGYCKVDVGCGCGNPAPGICGCYPCGPSTAGQTSNSFVAAIYNGNDPTITIGFYLLNGTFLFSVNGGDAPYASGGITTNLPTDNNFQINVTSTNGAVNSVAVFVATPEFRSLLLSSSITPYTEISLHAKNQTCASGFLAGYIESQFTVGQYPGYELTTCSGSVFNTRNNFDSQYSNFVGSTVYNVDTTCIPVSGAIYQGLGNSGESVAFAGLHNLYDLGNQTGAGMAGDGTLPFC